MNAANRCEETALHCFNEAAAVFVDINLLCCFVIDSCSVLAKDVCIEFFLKVYHQALFRGNPVCNPFC